MGVRAALAMFGINRNVLRNTAPYLRALNWSAPPLLLFFCFRRYLQAIGHCAANSDHADRS